MFVKRREMDDLVTVRAVSRVYFQELGENGVQVS